VFVQASLPPSVSDLVNSTLGVVFAYQTSLLNALSCAGLTVPRAWLGASLSAPPPPLADWAIFAQELQLILDIPFHSFQNQAMAYSPAVAHALGDMFGVDPATVWIVQLTALKSRDYTVVHFDLMTPDQVSESTENGPMPARILQYSSFFGSGNSSLVGGEKSRPALTAALQRYGLPIAEAFYGPWPDASL